MKPAAAVQGPSGRGGPCRDDGRSGGSGSVRESLGLCSSPCAGREGSPCATRGGRPLLARLPLFQDDVVALAGLRWKRSEAHQEPAGSSRSDSKAPGELRGQPRGGSGAATHLSWCPGRNRTRLGSSVSSARGQRAAQATAVPAEGSAAPSKGTSSAGRGRFRAARGLGAAGAGASCCGRQSRPQPVTFRLPAALRRGGTRGKPRLGGGSEGSASPPGFAAKLEGAPQAGEGTRPPQLRSPADLVDPGSGVLCRHD